MQIPVLVGILSTLLATDGKVTADSLAEKFEISKRSVYRYVSKLSEGGVPIQAQSGRGGGWSIVETYKLKAMFFTEEEYGRLLLAAQSFSLQDDVTTSATAKLLGLRRAVNANVLKSDQLIVDASNSLGGMVNDLSYAISSKRTVELEYHSKEGETTKRVVEPYCLVLKDNVWYCYCFCRLRKDFRYFKVSRIVKMQVTETTFTPRQFQADAGEIEAYATKNKERCKVVLSFNRSSLNAAEEWLGLGKVAQTDEGYIATATLPYDELLINKVLSLGNGVRVLAPEKLRQAVVDRCRSLAQTNGD